MSNLQLDLRSSQTHILTILGQYQTASEELIRSNYHTQLHSILGRIASFDHEQIAAGQTLIKDEVAAGFVREIAEKMRSGSSGGREDKKEVERVEKEESKPKPTAVKQEEKKDNASQKGGFFGFISKFTNKQKKATEMILTESEEKCYYDPVTRSWIFEGDQPEAPKVIPKPPSMAEKKERQEMKKEKQRQKGEDSQINQLTAPPAFKRRSTPGTATKSKIKIKEEVAVVRIVEEPMTYARLVEQINASYSDLLEKVESGIYDKHAIVQTQNNENWSQFLAFADTTIHMNAQIEQSESKIIEKWSRIITSQSRELKIMEKVIRGISESATVYSDVMAKIEGLSHQHQRQDTKTNNDLGDITVEMVESYCQVNIQASQESQEVLRRLREACLELEQQNEKYFLETYNHKLAKEELQVSLSLLQDEKQAMSQQKEQQQQQIDKLSQQIVQYEETMKLQQQQYNQKLEQTIAQNRLESQNAIEGLNANLSNLQDKNTQLQEQIISLKQLLAEEKAKKVGNLQRINAQLLQQKSKIQTSLKFYSQKQKKYFTSVKAMADHQNILQDFQLSLTTQNQALLTILQNNSTHQSSSLLPQLADIIASITSSHLNRLESFAQCYTKLHSKYAQSKELLSTIRRNAAGQSMSLNRSVAKLKSTLEVYKSGRQEVQERCNYLELDCDKLKKKLEHYREEDHFNKSYLYKLKTSKINSQNESVMSLQEDKDELASEIDELQRELQQKDDALMKTQADLEDLLINYEKNQTKLMDFERKCKEKDKEVKQYKQSHEQLKNKIKLLQLKLKNEKQRYDEIQNRQENHLKNTESSFDKKLRLLKTELQQSYERQNSLKAQLQQTLKETNSRYNQLHLTHVNTVTEMNSNIAEKDRINKELFQLVGGVTKKWEMAIRERDDLQMQNQKLRENQIQQNARHHEAINEHIRQIEVYRESQASLNDSMTTLIANYSSYKQEQQEFKEQYLSRLLLLQEELQNSQLQSSELLLQINQYSEHVQSLNHHIQHIKQQQEAEKAQSEALMKQLIEESQKLKELTSSQTIDIEQYASLAEQLNAEIAKTKDDNERLSRERTDLQEKCMFKDRELETLQNQLNAATEKLMIKTEELLEKERNILEIEETSVTKREEFDELNNQLATTNRQLEEKRIQLEEQLQKNEDLRNSLAQKDEIIEQNTMALEEFQSIIQSNNEQVAQMSARTSELQQRHAHQQTKISVLQSKLLVKDEQITALLDKLQLLQSDSKDIADNDEVQGEMEYLLKEIQARETEVQNAKNAQREKEHELAELEKVVEILEEKFEQTLSKLNTEIIEKSILLQQIQVLTDNYKILQLEKLSLENQTYKTAKATIQQAEKIQDLQESLHSELVIEAEQIKTSSLQLVEDKKIIEDLIADARFKDQLIIDKARQIQEKQRMIAKLEEERERNDEEIRKQEKEIRSKASYIDELETKAEERQVELQQIREEFAEKSRRLDKLQDNISEMAAIIDDQDKTIAALRKAEKKGETSADPAELQQLKKRITELQENNKTLLDQNTALMDQKVELMKSNDYLVAMNQKLVAGKTFSSASKEALKTQSQILPSPSQKIDRTRSASEIQQKTEPKGFFGALSSLFLTPTEADRLQK